MDEKPVNAHQNLRKLKLVSLFSVFIFSALLSGCATTADKTTLTSLSSTNTNPDIIIMPVDVELSLLTAGGVMEPRADWTKTAETNISRAFQTYQTQHHMHLVNLKTADNNPKFSKQLHKIEQLNGLVGQSILVHEYMSEYHLPSKQKFNWSLGPEVKSLKEKDPNAQYALFVYLRDSYSSSGRIALQVVAALLGVGVQGGMQVGFASLIDLNSGKVVWFNRMINSGGDLRTAKSANSTVNYLLAGLPQ